MATVPRSCLLILTISLTFAKKDDLSLPPCPRHLQYLPQELPMHCRMPRNADEPYYQSLPSDEMPPPIPIPSFPGSPGMPPMPPGMMPPMMPGMGPPMPPMPPGMESHPGMGPPMPPMPPGAGPPMPGMSGPMPMPMPIPIAGGPPHKLPVIVMPFYSPDHTRKKYNPRPPRRRKPHHHHSSEAESNSHESEDTSDMDNEGGWWKGHKRHHKKYGISRRSNKHHIMKKKKKTELLTPVLQYVTKDGYVIFEKKITKNEANDWLGPKEEMKANGVINGNHGDFEVRETPAQSHKTEIENIDREEEPLKINAAEDENTKESNEMSESPQTEKPHKKYKRRRNGSSLRPGVKL